MLENATRWSVNKNFLCLCAMGCLVSAEALAATSGAQPQNPLGAGLFVAWGIAYLTRRRAIGGWLLYYYIQLYMSLLVSLIFFPQVISNLAPGEWDSTMRYVLFVLSTVPVVLAQGLEAFAATRLLFSRNEKNLHFLRKVLVALVAASGVSLAIDIAYFPEAPSIALDVLTFVFSGIWTAYFLKAKRVRLVFIELAWDYAAQTAPRPRTPAEKRYLLKRAALAAIATFVLFLLMMGAAMGDKKPDTGIFFVPIFYALVAAAIGWYVPIRKKKLEALLNAQTTDETGTHGQP
jgi:hypothetical protein